MTENVAIPDGEKQAAKSVTDDLIVDGEFEGLDPAPQSSAGGAGVGNAVDSRRTNTNTTQAICGAVRRSERFKSRRTTSLNAAFPDGSGRAAGVHFRQAFGTFGGLLCAPGPGRQAGEQSSAQGNVPLPLVLSHALRWQARSWSGPARSERSSPKVLGLDDLDRSGAGSPARVDVAGARQGGAGSAFRGRKVSGGHTGARNAALQPSWGVVVSEKSSQKRCSGVNIQK